jgi:hypothetical protein
MRRSLPTTLVVVVGLLLLADFAIVNPSLAAIAGALLEYIVLLAAAAAIAGGLALALRHIGDLRHARGDRAGSLLLLAGMAAMLVAGFFPGSGGAGDPVVRWLVGALLAPLVAALFALLFFFLLAAARRGLRLRSRETTVMLLAAALVLILLLPIGGAVGTWLAAVAGWTLNVPIGAVFRGLLIGVAIATAIAAARILLAIDGAVEE